jgi:hypothetical protein
MKRRQDRLPTSLAFVLIALCGAIPWLADKAQAQVGPGGWCAAMTTKDAKARTEAYRVSHPGRAIGWMFAGSPYAATSTFEIWSDGKLAQKIVVKNLCRKARS